MRKLVLAALAATMLCGVANAAVVEYTNRAQFIAATGPVTVETFDVGKPTAFSYQTSGGTAYASVGKSDNPLYNVNFSNQLFIYLQNVKGSPSAITITFSVPIFSFGADFKSLNNSTPRTYATVGGTTFDPLPIDPTFLGFVSETSFTSLMFTNRPGGDRSDAFGLDNATFSRSALTAAVPEPASWAMMVGGFGLVGMAMRRRKVAISFA